MPEKDFLDTLTGIKHAQIKKYEYFQRKLCVSLVKHPILHFLFHWLVLFVFVIVVLLKGYFNLGDISINDFAVLDDGRVQDFFLNNELRSNFELEIAPPLVEEPEIATRSIQVSSGAGIFLYEASGEIFTPQNVFEICQVEKRFTQNSRMNEFCPTLVPRGRNTRCSAQIVSLSFVFYGNELECRKLDEDEIETKLSLLFEQQRNFFFDDIEKPTIVRSVIFVAGPLGPDSPPFLDFEKASNSVRNSQATGGYSTLLADFTKELFKFFDVRDGAIFRGFGRREFETESSGSTLKVRVGGTLLENTELLSVLNVDQLLSGGSYVLVLILVAIYIQSLVLAFVSMIGVLLSLVVALTIYTGILGINYFTPLNILVLFLIAGVGADNVLVMVDAWRQSELDVQQDIGMSFKKNQKFTKDTYDEFLVNRLVYTMERSIMAVSNTALTTFTAFIATAISPIPAIAALGYFAAITIIINWWYMFSLHPANLMWHFYLFVKVIPDEKIGRPQHKSRRSSINYSVRTALTTIINFERGVHDAALDTTARISMAMRFQEMEQAKLDSDGYQEVPVRADLVHIPKKLSAGDVSSMYSTSRQSMKPPGLASIKAMGMRKKDEPATRFLDKLFEKFSYFINETPGRYLLVGVMCCFMAFLLTRALQLETPSNIESNFPPDHMFGTFLLDFASKFPDLDASAFAEVNIAVGIKDFDVSGITKLSSNKNGGVHILDPDFEIFSKQSQDFLLELCGPLSEIECGLFGCTEDTLFRNSSEQKNCPFEKFQINVFENTNFTSTVVGAPGGPPDNESFNDLAFKFGSSNNFGMVNNEVIFISIRNRLSLRRFQALTTKQPVLDLLQDEIVKLRRRAPAEVSSISFSLEENVLMVTELSLISGMFQGLVISLVASFFVLLIGTQSFRIALLAVISVGGVALAVLGTIQVQGGQLGTAESIAGVFVIGLSVDYIVHLGHMYKHSIAFLKGKSNPNHGSRRMYHRIFRRDELLVFKKKDKVDFTLRKMGPTVLAGALTTLCSAIFLSLCTFAFFGKMSNMLLLTVVYALMVSFFFFIPCLRICGPGE